MSTGRLVALLMVALLSAACQTGGTVLAPIGSGVSIHADPSGDAGAAPTFDIIEFRSERTATTLSVRIWTSPAMVLPASGAFSAAGQAMFITAFNTDLDRTTGASMGSTCGGGQGLDFVIWGGFSFPRNADGTFPVTNAALVGTGSATASVDGPRLTLTVPLSALGGDDGRTEAEVLVGNGPDIGSDWRDCAPDPGAMLPTRQGEKVLSRP